MSIFNNKWKMNIVMVVVLAMLMQIVVPMVTGLVFAEGEEGPKDLGDIFTTVTVQVNGVTVNDDITIIDIEKEMHVLLLLEWKIDDDTDDEMKLVSGDYAEIQVPQAFERIVGKESGDVKFGDETVGTYELGENGVLRITFNNVLESKKDRYGEVGVLLEFDKREFEDDAAQEIIFEGPISTNFTITAKPGGDTSLLSKWGEPDAAINAKYINYVIDVNTSLEKLNNAKVEDVIPVGLELEGEIEVYELTVGYTGMITEGNKVNSVDKFPVELVETNKAYRIKYKTKIIAYPEGGYINNASLTDDGEIKKEASFPIDKITRGDLILKRGEANKNGKNSTEIKWEIDINTAEDTLTNVSMEEQLPSGVSFKDGSIKIYKLKKSGTSWVKDGDVTANFEPVNNEILTFPLSLGTIDQVYRIVFDTTIDNAEEYKISTEFENEAKLLINSKVEDSAKAEVTITKGTLIEKSGKETTSYNEPHITWTIHVNKANHYIKNATLTDVIGDGHKLRNGSIKIGNEELPVGGTEFPRITEQSDDGFVIEFGDINNSYTITYITDITDPNATVYPNEATLGGSGLKGDGITGDGIGNGTISSGTGDTKPSVSNSYIKSTLTNKTLGTDDNQITYNGIDYDKKTMSWKITIDAKKEALKSLVITDSFTPEKSMVFLNDTLRVVNVSGELIQDSNYTVTDYEEGGFVIDFNFNPAQKSKFEIYYKTSFDPVTVLDKKGTLNTGRQYTNTAVFTGTTVDITNVEKPIGSIEKPVTVFVK